jgi:hypothetical protein
VLSTTTQRVLCALPPAAFAEAVLDTQIRASGSKGQESTLAECAHPNHVKSVIYFSWRQRRQIAYSNVSCR